MNRRNFFAASAGALLGNSIVASGAGQEPQPSSRLRFKSERTGTVPFRLADGKKPHIMLISADMVSPDLYHPARPVSQHIRIPNIRSLMQDGAFFSNAFCTVPLCSPSRASY